LAAALQYVDVPEYSAIILRRTLVDLQKPKALMDLAYSWLSPTAAQWSEKQKAWIFPSQGSKSGATLSFGYMETEKDKIQYQGAAYQYVGFDELTQFTRTQYLYMFSRRRRTAGQPVPLRTRSSSNPGGDGHAWVYERFFTNADEKDTRGRRKRLFIPAKLSDNPHLDADEYRESMAELPLVERLQLLEGDWTAKTTGGWFREEWLPVVPMAPRVRVRRVRYWDLATTKPSAHNADPDFTRGVLMAEAGGRFWIEHVATIRSGPAETEEFIAATAHADGPAVDQWIEQEPGAQSELFINTLARGPMKGLNVRGHRVTGDKATRAKPLSAACSNGLVSLVEGAWNRSFRDELIAFPAAGVHDDQVDAASGAHQKLSRMVKSEGGATVPPPSGYDSMKGM
jgi:predicted phage terminase large subunit-like protein